MKFCIDIIIRLRTNPKGNSVLVSNVIGDDDSSFMIFVMEIQVFVCVESLLTN
jgi:hypothetical protein